MLTRSEISKHKSRTSCWVIIRGTVYDLTSMLDSHPGGRKVILKYGGKDATEAFEPIHPGDTLEKSLNASQMLGPIEDNEETANSSRPSLPSPCPVPKIVVEKNDKREEIPTSPQRSIRRKPRLKSIVSLHDFELAAEATLPTRSFAFFKTGAEDEHTARWNRRSWATIRFRPRIMRPLPAPTSIDLATTILGSRFSAPFFICPAGGAKLASPNHKHEGDVLLTKGAAQHGILHWACNNGGCTQREIAEARKVPGQNLFWQIYARADLVVTEGEIRQAAALGYKGFALTVDAVVAGKRERDARASIAAEEEEAGEEVEDEDEEDEDSFATGPTVGRPVTFTNFDWRPTVAWLRSLTDLPIAIKGVQTWEDALLCMHHGVHPWLSNHGARQLDGAPAAVDTLVEIRRHCPEVLARCDVIVDGGVTRGTDVVKALCLGARAVGLGRPFLFSLTFGEKGVGKAIRILRHEMEVCLALLGVDSLEKLSAEYVDTSALVYGRAHL